MGSEALRPVALARPFGLPSRAPPIAPAEAEAEPNHIDLDLDPEYA